MAKARVKRKVKMATTTGGGKAYVEGVIDGFFGKLVRTVGVPVLLGVISWLGSQYWEALSNEFRSQFQALHEEDAKIREEAQEDRVEAAEIQKDNVKIQQEVVQSINQIQQTIGQQQVLIQQQTEAFKEDIQDVEHRTEKLEDRLNGNKPRSP